MTPRALFHPARLARRPVLSTQSDERLVDLVRAGSDPAFEAIVERYRRALMRYVSRLLPPERAEDVVQQTFVKAYEAMRRDAAELNLKPWLYRIAHNGALNALRDRALGHASWTSGSTASSAGPGARADARVARARGGRAGAPRAPAGRDPAPRARGRSYEEIALALGVTDGAVRQLLNRAQHAALGGRRRSCLPLVTRLAAGESTSRSLPGWPSSPASAAALAMKLCATAS